MEQLKYVLGIDIGGTKLAAGVVDSQGRVHSYRAEPTRRELDAAGLFEQVANLAGRAIAESGLQPAATGAGCGGPMEFPAGVVSPLHIPAWRAFPLRARLEQKFGLPAVVDNDAKAFALGEAIFGAGRGARCLLGMVVSTGVGGGIVCDGRLLHGATGNAGHAGHIIAARPGEVCECGARGCLSCYASGTGLRQRALAALARGETGRLAGLSPEAISAQAIAEAAGRGDPLAGELWRAAVDALAVSLAGSAALLDLDRVVIGGGVARAGGQLFDPLRQRYKDYAGLSFSRGLDIRPAERGREAGVVGAAALAFSQFNR